MKTSSICTIKSGSRRSEKSRKVLMMMMTAAKLGWAGPGAGQEQGWSKARTGLKHDQGRSSLRTKSNQNWMKNTDVEKIHFWSALVGQLGRSKYSRSHFKNILYPITNFTQIGRKIQKFKFSKFLKHKKVFQKSANY